MSSVKAGKHIHVDAALRYSTLGWAVIPLQTPEGNGCSCPREGCESVGKHPRTSNGLKDATTNEEVIRDWWRTWPDANIGIVTGLVSGLVVLDVDPRHGGDDSFKELEAQHGELPRTLRTRTGGGGEHVLFSYPHSDMDGQLRNRTKFLAGLDWRADGGYIVAPPSLHASGERYEWVDGPEDVQLVPPPEWLLALATRGQTTSPATGLIGDGEKPYMELVRGKISEGSRNATLASLGGYLRRRGFGEEIIAPFLQTINELRCNPPLSEEEVDGIAKSICRYQPDFPLETGVVGGEVDSSSLQLTYNNISLMVGSEVNHRFNAKALRDEALSGLDCDLRFLPLLGQQGFFVEGWSHLVVAYPKVGKTELLFQIATSWAPRKVLFLTEEDTRLWKHRLKNFPEWEAGTILPALGLPFARLLSEIKSSPEEVVVIDTIRLLSISDENDNSVVAARLIPVIAASREGGKTLVLVHHTRKGGGDHGEGISGGHAFLGLVDISLEISGDKTANRRVVKGRGRGGISGDLLYEMRENGLMVPFGRPQEIALEGVKERIVAVLMASGTWLKTAEVLAAIDDPRPSSEQVRLSLVELTREGRVQRHPPLGEPGQGKTHRWRIWAGESESECLAA